MSVDQQYIVFIIFPHRRVGIHALQHVPLLLMGFWRGRKERFSVEGERESSETAEQSEEDLFAAQVAGFAKVALTLFSLLFCLTCQYSRYF